jgi:hypothetical protein
MSESATQVNRKLLLRNVNKADAGEYECFLTNGEREIVKLTVHGQYFKPKENAPLSYEKKEIVKDSSGGVSFKKSYYFTSNLVL